MQILDLDQGAPEWFAARIGKPTASCFNKLITSTGKKSTQMDGYINTLIAEELMGAPADFYTNESMRRGTELEPEARAWYEFQTDIDVEQVGFVLRDDGLVGCSPDGITPFGGLEIKCPGAGTHVSYLLANKVPAAYVPQVQGCMWLCERDNWDFVSYHPDMPKLHIVVARDNDFIATLDSLITELLDKKTAALHQIQKVAA